MSKKMRAIGLIVFSLLIVLLLVALFWQKNYESDKMPTAAVSESESVVIYTPGEQVVREDLAGNKSRLQVPSQEESKEKDRQALPDNSGAIVTQQSISIVDEKREPQKSLSQPKNEEMKPPASVPKPVELGLADSTTEKMNQPLAMPKPAPASPPVVQPSKKVVTTAPTSSADLAKIRAASEPTDRENYVHFEEQSIKRVSEHPVSTFSIDVDTGSYTNVRRMLNQGQLPRHDAVRVEEMINYFSYNYPLPDRLDPPFNLTTEIAPTPWNQKTLLLHIGIKGFEIPKEKLPPANLVFLVDVSGSMRRANKLGLLKTSLKLLSKQLTAKDKVSVVVYAGASGLVLEPTPGNQSGKINAALSRLRAGGSTNGGAGIQLAYAIAEQAFIKGGINRVLLATDGDFNVGTVNFQALKNLIEAKRKSGISLTTLGFGTGNYNDHLMEQLADVGNGNYAYIDNLAEAQKVLVDEMASTIKTIAKDVKIQIEFNPKIVAEYRLIGYENRVLKREDFSNDKVDAGEIGAGHTVTALYEIALADSGGERLESLRYSNTAPNEVPHSDELAFLRLRYKAPNGSTSKLLEWPLMRKDIIETVDNTSERFRFSAAVAAFGQQLRGGKYLKQFSYENILKLARGARGDDPFGYRGEFTKLVNLAKSLSK